MQPLKAIKELQLLSILKNRLQRQLSKKKLDCYKALCEADNLDTVSAEKIFYHSKRNHRNRSKATCF